MNLQSKYWERQNLRWSCLFNKWVCQFWDWVTSNWGVGQRGPIGINKTTQAISKAISYFTKDVVQQRPHCWRQYAHNSLDMEISSWCVHRAFITMFQPLFFFLGRYSASNQKRNINTKIAATPLINKGVLPLRCTSAVVAQSLWE